MDELQELGRGRQLEAHTSNDGGHPLRPKPPVTRRRSLDNLSSSRKNTLANNDASVSRLIKYFEELDTARTHETVVQGELDAIEQEWHRQRKAFRRSRVQYENGVDPFNSPLNVSSTDQSIRVLRENCINDRSLLESQAVKVRAVQRKLHLAQTIRARCELDFMQYAHKWTVETGLPPPRFKDPPTNPYTRQPGEYPTPTNSTIEMELLAKRYNSKVAEVNSLGERLADQNYEYWNEVARRELRQDHDETLSVTDEQFEEMFSRDREVVSQELARVIEEAKQIKAEGSHAFTSTNRHSWHSPELESAVLNNASSGPRQGYQSSLQAALAKVPPEAFLDAEYIRGDTSERGSADSEPAKNIQLVANWMDDVPLGQNIDGTSD